MDFAAYRFQPPYLDAVLVNGPPAKPNLQPPHGTILLIRPLHGAESLVIEAVIDSLVFEWPSCAVCLWLDLVSVTERTTLSVKSIAHGASCFIPHAQLQIAAMRPQITDAALLASAVIPWLVRRLPSLSPGSEQILRLLFGEAGSHSTLDSLSSAHQMSSQQVRRALMKDGLQSAGEWFQVAHVLQAALRVQSEPGVPLRRFAEESRYADSAALRQRFASVFGTSATEIRRCLGWQWMLWAALRRLRLIEKGQVQHASDLKL